MSFIDIILLILLGGFVLFGFWFGIIHTLGALVGTILGAYVASHYFSPVAIFIGDKIGGNLSVLKVITFILIFTVANRLVGLIFYLAEKVFKVLSIIPFLKTINRLAGAVLGLIEGALVIGLILHVAGVIPLTSWFVERVLDPSSVARYLLGVARVLVPLLPEALRILGLPQLPL